MKFNNLADRDEEEFTCIVNLTGSPLNHTLIAIDTPFPTFPSFSGDKDYNNIWKKSTKESKYNPNHPVTQFIYKNLGTPDEKSYEQQVGKPKISKNKEGKLIKQFPTASEQDYICAQVLSKVWASAGGKMERVSFNYASNEMSFTAKWDYNKNKFVVVTN